MYNIVTHTYYLYTTTSYKHTLKYKNIDCTLKYDHSNTQHLLHVKNRSFFKSLKEKFTHLTHISSDYNKNYTSIVQVNATISFYFPRVHKQNFTSNNTLMNIN